MEANIRSLQTKEPSSPILDRYAKIGEWLIGKRLETEQETRDAGIKFVRELCLRLKVPSLRGFGLKLEDLPEIANQFISFMNIKRCIKTRSNQTIYNLLEKFVKLGVLKEVSGRKRDRIYVFQQLLDILE
jgi:alcohol dehydrogenase class IV